MMNTIRRASRCTLQTFSCTLNNYSFDPNQFLPIKVGENNVNEIYCDHQCFLFISAKIAPPNISTHYVSSFHSSTIFCAFWTLVSLVCGPCLFVLQARSGPYLWFKFPTIVLVLLFFFSFFCETDVEIRFRNLWNGCRHSFHSSFFFFFVKQMLKSASGICETDVDIRFTIRFVVFFVLFWNGCRNPFQEFLKRMSTSVLLFFFCFLCTITDVDIHFFCFLFGVPRISKSVSSVDIVQKCDSAGKHQKAKKKTIRCSISRIRCRHSWYTKTR